MCYLHDGCEVFECNDMIVGCKELYAYNFQVVEVYFQQSNNIFEVYLQNSQVNPLVWCQEKCGGVVSNARKIFVHMYKK